MAADKREIESVVKVSTSSLQAEMLTMAQTFKGIMAECAATVAADSKSQISQAVSQAMRDNDGGGRRNRNDDRRRGDRNDRRGEGRRDDTRSPGELVCFYCEQYGDSGCETRGHCKCGRCNLHPSDHSSKQCPWKNQADREGANSGTGASDSEQAMPELPACPPCDEQPCHAIDAQPVQPTVSHSRDAKLQPDDETAVSAALLERTRADAFKELALEMTETMIQNVHKLNDKQSLDLTPHQNKFEVNPSPPLPIATRAGSAASERERECKCRREHEHSSQMAQAKSETMREAESRCEETEVQPKGPASMSTPAQPGPVPCQPSPTRVGQKEHPQDANRQAQASKLTRIGIEKATQAHKAKSFPLQRQSQPHAQGPVSEVSLHELRTEAPLCDTEKRQNRFN